MHPRHPVRAFARSQMRAPPSTGVVIGLVGGLAVSGGRSKCGVLGVPGFAGGVWGSVWPLDRFCGCLGFAGERQGCPRAGWVAGLGVGVTPDWRVRKELVLPRELVVAVDEARGVQSFTGYVADALREVLRQSAIVGRVEGSSTVRGGGRANVVRIPGGHRRSFVKPVAPRRVAPKRAVVRPLEAPVPPELGRDRARVFRERVQRAE